MENTNTDNYTPEQIKKLIEVKDNYKNGMLKYKEQVKKLKAENERLRGKIDKLLDKIIN